MLKFEFNGSGFDSLIFSSSNGPSDATYPAHPPKISNISTPREGSQAEEHLLSPCCDSSSLLTQSGGNFFGLGKPPWEFIWEATHLSSVVYFRSFCFDKFVWEFSVMPPVLILIEFFSSVSQCDSSWGCSVPVQADSLFCTNEPFPNWPTAPIFLTEQLFIPSRPAFSWLTVQLPPPPEAIDPLLPCFSPSSSRLARRSSCYEIGLC